MSYSTLPIAPKFRINLPLGTKITRKIFGTDPINCVLTATGNVPKLRDSVIMYWNEYDAFIAENANINLFLKSIIYF